MELDWRMVYGIVKDLLLLAAVFYTWWCNREKVTARRFEALEKDVSKRVTDEALKAIEHEREANCDLHEQRTRKVEQDLARIGNDIRHMPNHADLARIHGRIDEVHGAVREMSGSVKGIGHQVTLILEEMLKR
jgi:hypothetical protein